MNRNFYETNLLQNLREDIEFKRIEKVDDSYSFFEQLAKAYPANGSKIDWGQVPGSIERVEKNTTIQVEKFSAFFAEVVQQFCLSGDVVYIGDSATDFALTGSITCIQKILPNLFVLAQT